ncbi:glyoxylate carboligase [Azotobacter vinelandii CA]|uniref:Glyoxylate carboligase n=2 Tax=Azotobacter vinelandii TaxID=354 RepID=C1DFR5_AZOVD|nr:glyoxylate carboligase [Azotobacter vinelandii]ACO80461.1 glyoxylate carboligase [Azotobacter vinelandii DJ]AGK12599.1 glyoxylate carboligase [Azotobacter vinelandii CA]AGK17980.1 glyoxylate carboligase [Azotobacter vinelandii CA6]GLK58509.1 glyoxylate carboligase [Azotobacter vinelandii]
MLAAPGRFPTKYFHESVSVEFAINYDFIVSDESRRSNTRTNPGNIGVCIGTSGPAGTDMVTGLYSASADSIPILCITGQAPRARLHKEDFQAVDITSIVKPVTKWASTVLEPGLVPYAFQKAFFEMRSGRPGPVLLDLPFDVQMAEIEFDIDAYQPLSVSRPSASRIQAEKALAMLNEAERPLIVAGGGIINADAADKLVEFAELTGVPVIPTLMGWGSIPDDHRLMVGMCGLQTAHRYGNANLLASDLVFGIGNRWANRHTGSVEVYTRDRRFIHVDIEPTQIGRVFTPDLGIVSDAGAALDAFLEVAREWRAAGRLKDRGGWVEACRERKRSLQRKTHFDEVPIKPQRVYEEMNAFFGKDTCYVSTIGLSQIAGAQFLHVYKPRHWINCGQAGPLGWTIPAALGVVKADPRRPVVALSGDYDFQFMIEELAVGAQFNLPYIHVLVNNSYLGLIRQAQRNFEIDYCVQLSFENINAPQLNGYGVDHVAVVEGLGCKAIRVFEPGELPGAFARARQLMKEFRVPVVVEVILERVTNIAMGTEIDAVTEFEELARTGADAPTSILPLD